MSQFLLHTCALESVHGHSVSNPDAFMSQRVQEEDAYVETDKVILKKTSAFGYQNNFGSCFSKGQDVKESALADRVLPYSASEYNSTKDMILYRVIAMKARAQLL